MNNIIEFIKKYKKDYIIIFAVYYNNNFHLLALDKKYNKKDLDVITNDMYFFELNGKYLYYNHINFDYYPIIDKQELEYAFNNYDLHVVIHESEIKRKIKIIYDK